MITKSAAAQRLLTRALKHTEHVDALEKEWGKKGHGAFNFNSAETPQVFRQCCVAAVTSLPPPKNSLTAPTVIRRPPSLLMQINFSLRP